MSANVNSWRLNATSSENVTTRKDFEVFYDLMFLFSLVFEILAHYQSVDGLYNHTYAWAV